MADMVLWGFDGSTDVRTVEMLLAVTPDEDAVCDVPGSAEWRAAIQALPSFQSTQPG